MSLMQARWKGGTTTTYKGGGGTSNSNKYKLKENPLAEYGVPLPAYSTDTNIPSQIVKSSGKYASTGTPSSSSGNVTLPTSISYGGSSQTKNYSTPAEYNAALAAYNAANEPATLQDLIDEYQSAYDEAKASNESRYGEIKTGYDTMLSEQMKNLEGSGAQEKQDIENTWEGKESQGMQDLVSQGMYASTIKPTMSMGYTSAKNADLSSLNQRLLNAKTSIYGDIAQNKLNFMNSREDTYPDYNQLLTLAQMQGQTNAGTKSSSSSGGSNTPIKSSGTTTGGGVIHVKNSGWSDDPFTNKVRGVKNGWSTKKTTTKKTSLK
jgi:hypothetical protein